MAVVEKLESRPAIEAERKISVSEDALLFLFASLVYLPSAYYLVFHRHFWAGDAIARVFHAFLVFYGREPKLASIGFIWPPIPTLVLLPLVIVKPLALSGFAANIASATFTALTAVYLNKICKLYEIAKLPRYGFLVLYLLNPLIFTLAINGLSESISIFFLVFGMYYFLRWVKSKRFSFLALAGLAMGLDFLSRYETLLIGGILFVWAALIMSEERPVNQEKMEGALLGYTTPVVYSVFLWGFFNWLIMGHPLFFLRSPRAALNITLVDGGSKLQCLSFSDGLMLSGRIWVSMFPFAILLALISLLLALKTRSWLWIGFVVALLQVPAFTTLLFYRCIPPILRYFVATIPLSFIALAASLGYWQKRYDSTLKKSLVVGLVSLALVPSNFATHLALMHTPQWGDMEVGAWRVFWGEKLPPSHLDVQQKIALYVREYTDPEAEILLDDYSGFMIVFLSGDPSRFIISTDSDFIPAIRAPFRYADYILIPEPAGRGLVDKINQAYPSLYAEGAPWATLEKEFRSELANWRLYKIVRGAGR